MNRRKVRQLLEVFRAHGADAKDPHFAEALHEIEGDPKLARWFADQQRFDRIISGSLKALTAPVDLKEDILASRKVVNIPFWRNWRVQGAAAACVIAGLVVFAVTGLSRSTPFPELRTALVKEAWGTDSHLDFESNDLVHVQQWLARQFVPVHFKLPEGLHQAHIVGCRVVEAEGQRVPMICLADGSRHLHLFVMDGISLTDLPAQGVPDFEKCAQWKTAAWQDGKRTYVLTGMNYQTFVSRFRKSGRWTTSG